MWFEAHNDDELVIEAVKPRTLDNEMFNLTVENLVEIAGEQREDVEEILGVGESE